MYKHLPFKLGLDLTNTQIIQIINVYENFLKSAMN